jgi:uncharacterized SAM-binding protein YcdF (DUF218 family)
MSARLPAMARRALMLAGTLLLAITFTPMVQWTASRLGAAWGDPEGDVLVVLGAETVQYPGFPSGMIIGESTYWRVLHAIYVWRQGHFRTMLVCGRGSAATVKPILIAYGVPEAAILVEDRSTHTRENALYAKPILAGLPGRVVLITSDYHMYRARRCFAREGIAVIPQPSPDVLKRCRSWTSRWPAFWMVAGELAKIAWYRARGWI